MKIIFYGTPEFAVPTLELLVEQGKNIIAVVTAPDKPAGRGRQLKVSPVKEAAMRLSIPVLQPTKLKDPEFLEQLRHLQPDLQIVVAFRMMPESVWNLPTLGTFNLHGSLLPQYRGAAPINWAIINGEEKTGVTTFFLQQEIDTGNIIFSEEILIDQNENVTSLHDRMKKIGAGLVLKTVNAIENGAVTSIPQDQLQDTPLRAAPKLNKENTKIHFSNDPLQIHNLIRGLSYYPGAHCEMTIGNETVPVKIFNSLPHFQHHNKKIGSIETDNKTFLKIYCTSGFIEVLEIQLPGKAKMAIRAVLNGHRLDPDILFK